MTEVSACTNTIAQHEPGTRQTISLVCVHSIKLSSQCNMTTQIKPMQDKTQHHR